MSKPGASLANADNPIYFMETNKLEPAMDKAKLATDETGTGERQSDYIPTVASVLIGPSHTSTVRCGPFLEDLRFLFQELEKKLDLPEGPKYWHTRLEIATAGLLVSFNEGEVEYGEVLLQILWPQVRVKADTVLHQLEGTQGVTFVVEDPDCAVAWTCELAHRLRRLRHFWDEETIRYAARQLYGGLAGHPPQ
ncbi:hypothetical protein BH09VER1_BH09VER1_17950 [soil metagenome]